MSGLGRICKNCTSLRTWSMIGARGDVGLRLKISRRGYNCVFRCSVWAYISNYVYRMFGTVVFLGPVLSGEDFPPLQNSGNLGGQKTADGPGPAVKHTKNQSPINAGLIYGSTGPGMNDNLGCLQKLQNEAQRKGSGFFDVSKNSFGPRQCPSLETKNSFESLQVEEDCFDTEHGLWEKEMLMVRKFYETDTQPPDDVFKSWSEKLRTYYMMLTKFEPVNEAMIETKNEDEIEVESETDESARDIARGV
ncbi:hypothetical protein Hanom_Chr12g01131131 [Helianthus anomalus]